MTTLEELPVAAREREDTSGSVALSEEAAAELAPPVEPRGASPRVRLPHEPALDGLRGIAVAAVLCFHAAYGFRQGTFGWAKGGFLGVSTFFTLSGFLITSLLLVE